MLGAGETARQLRTNAALAEHQASDPSTHIKGPRPPDPSTPGVPRPLLTASGTALMSECTGTHIYTLHIPFKISQIKNRPLSECPTVQNASGPTIFLLKKELLEGFPYSTNQQGNLEGGTLSVAPSEQTDSPNPEQV